MKKKVLMMTMAAATLSAIAQQPVDYVNPIIGTNGMGHTFPGACTPFGWVQLSPDTDTIPHNVNGAYQKNAYEYCAGYQYRDKTIVGFSHTHLSGTGHSDLGDILLMPAVGDVKLNPGRANHPEEGYRSRFDHATEKAVPGYYEVMLDDYGIKAQLTATQRTGVHKYTFPKGKDGHLILDLVHGIYNYDGKVLWANLRVENDTLLTGYRITNGWARTNYTYFAISFSQPVRDYGYKDKEKSLYNGFWRRFSLEKNFPEITGRKIVAVPWQSVLLPPKNASGQSGAMPHPRQSPHTIHIQGRFQAILSTYELLASCIIYRLHRSRSASISQHHIPLKPFFLQKRGQARFFPDVLHRISMYGCQNPAATVHHIAKRLQIILTADLVHRDHLRCH